MAASLSIDEGLIRSVLTRERYYRDTCQFEKMRKTYHPDGKKTWVEISWYTGEIDGFIDGSRAVTHGKINTVHNLFESEVEINGNRATAECICNITSRFAHQGSEFDKITTCRLLNRLEKLPESQEPSGNPWKLLSLEPIYIRDSFVPAAPIAPEKTPVFEGLEDFPNKAYRHGAWLLKSIGISSRSDLPDEENRPVVEALLGRNKQWLADGKPIAHEQK